MVVIVQLVRPIHWNFRFDAMEFIAEKIIDK